GQLVRPHECCAARPAGARGSLARPGRNAGSAVMARSPRSAYARLFAEPRRFGFDAAVRILARTARTADPSEAARFRSAPGLSYPAAEVTALEPPKDSGAPVLTTPVIGLTGAAGVLPRLYTEVLTTTLRNLSHALHDFLDMLSNR